MEEQSASTSEIDVGLRSFLNTLTTHLLPDLSTTFDEETDEELPSQQDQSEASQQQKSADQTTVPADNREKDNEEQSNSILDTITNTISKVQETILGKQEESSTSMDSLVNIVEEMKTIGRQKEEEVEPLRLDQNVSSTTDEMSSTDLQSKQKTSQDIDNDRQEQLLPDSEKSSQLMKQEDNLSSMPSADENLPSVNTFEVQEQQQQQQPISRLSTTESTEKTTLIGRQSSTELQSTQDSLATTDRQIDTLPPQITPLPSTDNQTETSQTVEHALEKPSTDAVMEDVQSIEIIPHQLVTTEREDLSPKSSEISSITQTYEDESERLSTDALSEAVRQILATTITSQPRSELITKETVEQFDQKPSTDSTDTDIR